MLHESAAVKPTEQELAVCFENKKNISDAEQRVIRQVVEALLFEQLVDYQSSPRRTSESFESDCDNGYDLQLDFKIGGNHFRCLAAIKAFDRVRIAQGSIKLLAGNVLNDFRISELVACLDMDDRSKQHLCAELAQTIALCQWNRENLDLHLRPRRTLGFQELESAIHEGHLYHPCFKTRSGFSVQDHQRYGPEAGNRFQLRWLAVARRHMNIALSLTEGENEEVFWERELGKTQYSLLSSRLRDHEGSWSEYALVPVHPWQWQSIRELVVDEAVAGGEMIDLGFAGDDYHATQSMRTLVNASQPEKANVKVPLNIICTSSRRNLQQHFVCTAPVISQWLNTLIAKDAFLQEKQHLILLSEYAGMLYEPEHGINVAEEDTPQGLLGAIFRESVISKLQKGEAALPYTALMLIESDGRPFITDWLDYYGIEVWLNRLLEVVLIPIWHMLVHHGVALEVHAQNLILIHKQGWPEKIAIRDFHENTEYVTDYLGSPQDLPDFEKIDPYFRTIPDDDGYRMANVDELRELVMDTALVFNLADLSFLLERFFKFDEKTFWQAVRKCLNDYAQSGVTDLARINRLATDSPEIVVESLLKKKISSSGILQLYHHRVKNMLHSKRVEE